MQPTIMDLIQIVFSLVCRAIEHPFHLNLSSSPSKIELPYYCWVELLTLLISILIAEAYVGKGFFKKRINYHARGKCGMKVRPECRLTVVVREITPEEEAEIAKLRVSNFLKLTKRERRLVPHKLIETTPIWNRKGKVKSQA